MDKHVFKGNFVFCEGKIENYTINADNLGIMFAILDIHKMILEGFKHEDGLVDVFGRIDNVIKYISENHESIFDVKYILDKEKHEFTLTEIVGNNKNSLGISHNYSTEGRLSIEGLFVIMSILIDYLKESLETDDLSLVGGVLREFEESNEHNI